MKFINVPTSATAKIFTIDGHLIKIVKAVDFGNVGSMMWDRTNQPGEAVVSGVYFYVVQAQEVKTRRGARLP